MDGQSFVSSHPHPLNNIKLISLVRDPNPKPVTLVVNQQNRNGKVQTSNNLPTLPSQSTQPCFPSMAPSDLPPRKTIKQYQPLTITDLEKLPGSHALGLKTSTCDICIRGFDNISQLCEHLSCRPKLNIKCNVCITGFRSPEKLKHHLNKHMQLICPICHEAKPSLKPLQLHIESHKKQGISTRKDFLRQNSLPCEREYKRTKGRPAKSTSLNICNSALESKGYYYIKNKNYHHISGIYCLEKSKKTAPYTCTVCLREFPRSDHLVQHTMSHSGYRPFRCSLCTKGCFRPGKIVEHFVRTHCEDRNSIPELYFDDKENCVLTRLWTGSKATTAILYSTKKNSGKVLIDLPQTTNKKPLLMSVVNNGDNTEHSSNYDSEETLTADEGEREEKPHICSVCNAMFPSASMLIAHMTRLHAGSGLAKPAEDSSYYDSEETLTADEGEREEKPHICSICNAMSPSASMLLEHMTRLHAGSGLAKPVASDLNIMPTNSPSHSETLSSSADHSECNTTLQMPHLFKEHVKLQQNLNLPIYTNHAKAGDVNEGKREENSHICNICVTTFPSASTLEEHVTTLHSASRNCYSALGSTCYTYIKKKDYDRILSVFSQVELDNGDPYTCSVCQMKFILSKNLVYHKMSHSGYRPFRCSLCTAGVFQPEQIVEHFVRAHCQHEKMIPELYFDDKENCIVTRLWTRSRDGTKKLPLIRKISGKPLLKRLPQTARGRNVVSGHNKTDHMFLKQWHLEENRNYDSKETSEEGEWEKKAHICAICTNIFPSAFMLVEHMRTLHSPISDSAKVLIKVPQIPNKKPSPLNVDSGDDNIEDSSNNDSEETLSADEGEREEKLHICSVCRPPGIFASASMLVEHLTRLHAGSGPAKPAEDSSYYESEEILTADEGEREEKPHICRVCNAVFPSASMLVEHMTRLHAGSELAKPVVSDLNIMPTNSSTHSETSSSSANMHISEGINTSVCNAALQTPKLLMEQVKLHNDLKLSGCTNCAKSFQSPYQLAKHKLSCSSGTLKCGQCSNKYDTYLQYLLHCCQPGVNKSSFGNAPLPSHQSLLKHIPIHSAIELCSYDCVHCGECFETHSQLRVHCYTSLCHESAFSKK